MSATHPPIQVTADEWDSLMAIVAEHLPAHEVWAFGSRATGNSKLFSDLDLAVITKEPLSIAKLAELTEAFFESGLPWKVDLVDWCSTSEQFREIIQRDHVELVASPTPSETR